MRRASSACRRLVFAAFGFEGDFGAMPHHWSFAPKIQSGSWQKKSPVSRALFTKSVQESSALLIASLLAGPVYALLSRLTLLTSLLAGLLAALALLLAGL